MQFNARAFGFLIFTIMKIKYGLVIDVACSSSINDMSWLGAAINGVVNTAGIVTNAIQARRQRSANIRLQQDTNAQNLALAREQNAWSERMIDEQNAYNSPQNQRKLLESAGYNPALFSPDGMTQNTIPGSANLANQVAPRYYQDMTGFNQHLSQLANSGLTYLQAKQMEALTDKTVKESSQIREMTKQIQSTTKCNEEQARLIAVNVDKANEEIKQLRENILSTKLGRTKTMQDIKESQQRVIISRKQYSLQERLTIAQIQKVFSDIGLNDAQIKQISQNIVNLAATAVKTSKEIDVMELDRQYKSIVNKYLDDNQRAQLDKYSAEIYNSMSGSLYKNVQSFARDFFANLSSGFGSQPITRLGDYGSQLYDRINSQGGYRNYINQQY